MMGGYVAQQRGDGRAQHASTTTRDSPGIQANYNQTPIGRLAVSDLHHPSTRLVWHTTLHNMVYMFVKCIALIRFCLCSVTVGDL